MCRGSCIYFRCTRVCLKTKKSSLAKEFLQAFAVGAGMAAQLVYSIILDDTVVKPLAVSLDSGISQAKPNFFLEFPTFVIMGNILGLVPAILSAWCAVQLFQPQADYQPGLGCLRLSQNFYQRRADSITIQANEPTLNSLSV
jgi:hypothetical protein